MEFDHTKEQRTPMVLHGGEYIGDMCLLGVQDWAGLLICVCVCIYIWFRVSMTGQVCLCVCVCVYIYGVQDWAGYLYIYYVYYAFVYIHMRKSAFSPKPTPNLLKCTQILPPSLSRARALSLSHIPYVIQSRRAFGADFSTSTPHTLVA